MSQPVADAFEDHPPDAADPGPFPGSRLLETLIGLWVFLVLGAFLWLRVLESDTVRRLLRRGG